MNVNMDLYKIFVEVAKAGNISKAAERLFVSQSAVSQAVKLLESELGQRLFVRSPRGVTLTNEGELLISYARTACSLLNSAEQKFGEMKQMKFGSIRIGASDTVCSLFLIEILSKFHLKYPDITIQVTNRTTEESLALLRSGQVDIAFVNMPVSGDDLSITDVMKVHDCFVAGEKYKHLAKKPMELAELQNYPILMLERASNSRRAADVFFKKSGVSITPDIELGSLDLLQSFAAIGLGLALVIEEAADKQIKSGELYRLKLKNPLPERSIGMAMRKDGTQSTSAAIFTGLVRESLLIL